MRVFRALTALGLSLCVSLCVIPWILVELVSAGRAGAIPVKDKPTKLKFDDKTTNEFISPTIVEDDSTNEDIISDDDDHEENAAGTDGDVPILTDYGADSPATGRGAESERDKKIAKLRADLKKVRESSYTPGAPSVLILGGTGVRSHPTTELFLRKKYKITLLNRAMPYWDANSRLNNRVYQHWKCDREKRLHVCDPMTKWIKENREENFDLCVDFSSRKWIDFENMWQTMKGRCNFYIFVGSFQVYDVSGAKPKKKGMLKHGLKEQMARRPTKSMAPTERYELLNAYPDGDNYMKIEEALDHNYNKNRGWPFSVLRVGNVIGARECEIRQWFAQIWVHGHLRLGMPLHITSNDPISFSSNYDIAQGVWKVWAKWHSDDEDDQNAVLNEAFNIASEERFTQYQWYHAVADAVGLHKIQTTEFPVPDGANTTTFLTLYPENRPGHVINIEKAQKVLRFQPISLSKAIRQTAMFYEKAMTGDAFKAQRKIVMTKISKVMGGDTSLTSYVAKKYAELGNKYDEYEDQDYEEELDEKFRRLEL